METGKKIKLLPEQKPIIENCIKTKLMNDYGKEILRNIIKNNSYYSTTAPWLNLLRERYIKENE